MTSSWNKLSKNFLHVLEDDLSTNATEYNESNQISIIDGASFCLPSDEIEKIAVIVSRIHLLFSASLIFERQKNAWHYTMGYLGDRIFQTDIIVKNFPTQKLDEVLKIDTSKFIQMTEPAINEFKTLEKTSTLLFAPLNSYRILLISRKQDPWLKELSEKTLRTILNGIAE